MPTTLGDLYLDGPAPVYIGTVEGDVYVDGNPVTIGSPVRGDMLTGGTRCAKDVRQCPDGSYVSRQGANCEFAPCPKPGVREFLNAEGEQAIQNLVYSVANQWLTGAGMAIAITKLAVQERMFDSAVSALIAQAETAKPLPMLPLSDPIIRVGVTPASSFDALRAKYGQEIDNALRPGGEDYRIDLSNPELPAFLFDRERFAAFSDLLDRASQDPELGVVFSAEIVPTGDEGRIESAVANLFSN